MEILVGNVLKISVRNFVEFVLRNGDLDNRISASKNRDAMVLGSKLHRKIQGKMKGAYSAEVPLKMEFPYEKFVIVLEGRADGIIDDTCNTCTVDEIKTTYTDLEYIKEPDILHKAQAMCYGYMYCVINDYEEINIQITYANLDTEEIKRFSEKMEISYLRVWINEMMDKYSQWVDYMYENRKKLVDTARKIDFPFEYRKGQRDMVVSVYRAIKSKVNFFIQAPTGVGKTMSTIFPAIKAMGENMADKIFYLTAKTIAATVATDAIETLRQKGLAFKSVVITAKEKICILDDKPDCNPLKCDRAKGHFDRINQAVFDIINNEDNITRQKITEYAKKHNVCPFEMCLDVSSWVDGIICDYNYVFDRTAALKRYFGDNVQGRYIFLVDEAHNMIDRARDMYSAGIDREQILSVKKIVETRDKKLKNALGKTAGILNAYKDDIKSDSQGNRKGYMLLESEGQLELALMRCRDAMERFLEIHREFEDRDKVMDFYFKLLEYMDTVDRLDDSYEICIRIKESENVEARLMCINPSANIRLCLEKAVSAIFFSATLLPVNYYKELITGNTDDYAMYIDSPFSRKNRKIVIGRDVTTKYTKRNTDEFEKIGYYISNIISAKKGNYMVFFPSYKLMSDVYDVMMANGDFEGIDIIRQDSSMSEKEREDFLNSFKENREKTMAAFCIMGGIFSEGIDLTNERLIGTIIIGTGLPMVGYEREIIMNYFNKRDRNGFDYAYIYPGMNKVEQAAGRVIRTRDDVGIIALLDERFTRREYSRLFPREWSDAEIISMEQAGEKICRFWRSVE